MKTHTVNTSIGLALAQAAMKAIDEGLRMPLIEKIANAVDKSVVKRNDWNASLSFKTAQKLKKEGVLA